MKKISHFIFAHKETRFLVAGGVAYLVDFGFMLFFIHFFFGGKNYSLFDLIAVPQFMAALIGLTISFYLNRTWVFKATNKSIKKQGAKFILFTLFNSLLASLIFNFYYNTLSSTILSLGIAYNIMLFAVSMLKEVTKMGVSFLAYNKLIFKVK